MYKSIAATILLLIPTICSAQNEPLNSYDILGVKLGMSESEAKAALKKNLNNVVFEDIVTTSNITKAKTRAGFWGIVELTKKQEPTYDRKAYGLRATQSVAIVVGDDKVVAVSRYLTNNTRYEAPIEANDLIESVKKKYPEAGMKVKKSGVRFLYNVDPNGVAFPEEDHFSKDRPINHCGYMEYSTMDYAVDGKATPITSFKPNVCSTTFNMNVDIYNEKGTADLVRSTTTYLVDHVAGLKWLTHLDDVEKSRFKNEVSKTKAKPAL